MKGVKALVNPAVLRWARETAGFDVLKASDKLYVKPERLEAWEEGKDNPSFKQLIKLSSVYKRPIGAFYLPEAPDGPTLQYERDYRRLPGEARAHQSPELIFELRRCEYRRRVALELYDEMELEIPEVPYLVSLDEEVEVSAQRARDFLNVSIEAQLYEWKDLYQAFSGWRDALENVGILVFQASRIELNEMRAISIRERPLPFILLNSGDGINARIFSLIHEFIHSLLTVNRRTEIERPAEEQQVEVFCNAVTAALLMPAQVVQEFLHDIESYKDDTFIAMVAKRFSVSREVSVRRLHTLGLVDQAFYRQKREEYQREEEERAAKDKEKGGGPQYYIRVVNASGYRFTELVLRGLDSGSINAKEASDYFGASTKHFQDIRSLVQKHRESSGASV